MLRVLVAVNHASTLNIMQEFQQQDILDLLDGATDAETIRRIVFECLISGIDDERVTSLMNLIGWRGDFTCFALGGTPRESANITISAIEQAVHNLNGSHMLIGVYGSFVIACIMIEGAVSPEVTCTEALPAFSEDAALYLSPARSGVHGACRTVRETLFSLQAAPALAHQTRPLRADELLPERALLGDSYAYEELFHNVYRILRGENDDDPSFITVSTFLHNGGSLEITAKELNVHPNTVRYRLKRVAETTGWDATDPRDAYVLITAIAIGRMRDGN